MFTLCLFCDIFISDFGIFILGTMFRKVFVCLSLLNIAAYASEAPSPLNAADFERGTFVRQFVNRFCLYSMEKDKLDDMEKMIVQIPEGQRIPMMNAKSTVSHTAVMIASRFGNLNIVKWLVGHGADIYETDEAGCNAFQYARYGGQDDVLAYLHSVDGKRITPAPFKEPLLEEEEVEEKVNASGPGFEPDELVKVVREFTHLTYHMQTFSDMKKMFFGFSKKQRSQLINALDSGGTPLYWAAGVGNLISVKWLVDHGADIYAADENGHDAFWRAWRFGQTPVMDYLRSQDIRGKYKDFDATKAPIAEGSSLLFAYESKIRFAPLKALSLGRGPRLALGKGVHKLTLELESGFSVVSFRSQAEEHEQKRLENLANDYARVSFGLKNDLTLAEVNEAFAEIDEDN